MLTSTMWNIPATDHALCGRWPGSDEGAQFFACGNYPRVCPLQLNTWLTQSCPLKVYWCSGMKQCRLLPSKWYCFWLQKCLYVSHREYNSAVWRLAGQQKLTCVVDSVQVTRGAWHTHKHMCTVVSFLLPHARAWTTHNQGPIYDPDFGGEAI